MDEKIVIGVALLVALFYSSSSRASTGFVPRGIRNNNPGNLKDFGIKWRGLIGRDELGYCIFDSALNGIRAAYVDIRTGFTRDREDTVREIIEEWSPASDGNPTSNYIAFVARELGVTPDTPLVLENVRVPLLEAIFRFENGQQPYARTLIQQAIAAA